MSEWCRGKAVEESKVEMKGNLVRRTKVDAYKLCRKTSFLRLWFANPPLFPKEYKCKWIESESVASENNLNPMVSEEEEDNYKEDD